MSSMMQQVERTVVALEGVEGLLLVGADDVGNVVVGVDVADDTVRIVAPDFVAERMDQVGLAQADAAVDEQRVVGSAGVEGDLLGGGTSEIVGAAGDQGLESEIRG